MQDVHAPVSSHINVQYAQHACLYNMHSTLASSTRKGQINISIPFHQSKAAKIHISIHFHHSNAASSR